MGAMTSMMAPLTTPSALPAIGVKARLMVSEGYAPLRQYF
jgi:hypothetical protein